MQLLTNEMIEKVLPNLKRFILKQGYNEINELWIHIYESYDLYMNNLVLEVFLQYYLKFEEQK